MARPVVTPTTEEFYEALRPLVIRDEETGWTSLHIAEALVRRLDDVERLSRDTDDGPGWSAIVDSDRAPVEYLPWLAQFVGVSFLSTPTEAQMRQRIEDREGQGRGRPAAIVAAAKSTLTGSKVVVMEERHNGDPYALYVATYASQTPDPAATEAAILRQKPAGLFPFTYELLTGATYAELDAAFGTYADQDAAFGTYNDQKGYVP